MNFGPCYPIGILLAAIGLLPVGAKADLATIYFTEGEPKTVELVGVDRAHLLWKTSASATDVQMVLRSQVVNVAFPTTGTWRRAEEARESGDLDEALKYYHEVIADPAGHFFPFPGNFVSLAKERILQVYRLRMDVAMIAKQAQVVREEFLHLPPDYRRVEPETAAWTAIANGSWEEALDVLGEKETPTAETFFLKGRALEELGKKSEAVNEYAGAYVLNFGGSILLTRNALHRSSRLVDELGDPDRIAELQAQVKLYRDLYGKGKLWEGAPERLTSLADGEIKAIGETGGEFEKPLQSSPEMAGTVAEETATVATLAPKEDRYFFLPEEIPETIYALGMETETLPLTLEGGVKKEGEAFRFEGSGGFVRLEPVNANEPILKILIQFVAEAPDGILAHFESPGSGGFSLYLKGGEIFMDWAPHDTKVQTGVIGKFVPDRITNLSVTIKPDGARVASVDRTRFEDKLPAGGLNISQSGGVHIGDTGGGEERGETLSGTQLPPFKGLLRHFSVVTGDSIAVVDRLDVERFGKHVLLLPPTPEEEAKSPNSLPSRELP